MCGFRLLQEGHRGLRAPRVTRKLGLGSLVPWGPRPLESRGPGSRPGPDPTGLAWPRTQRPLVGRCQELAAPLQPRVGRPPTLEAVWRPLPSASPPHPPLPSALLSAGPLGLESGTTEGSLGPSQTQHSAALWPGSPVSRTCVLVGKGWGVFPSVAARRPQRSAEDARSTWSTCGCWSFLSPLAPWPLGCPLCAPNMALLRTARGPSLLDPPGPGWGEHSG